MANEFQAERIRRKDANREQLIGAWYVAALSRMARIEKLPKLDELLAGIDGPRRQTPAEQRAVLYRLSAQYGIPLKVKSPDGQ